MELKIGDHTAYHADNRSDKNTLAMHSSSYPPIPTQLYFQQLASASEVKSDGNGGGNYSHYGTAMPGIDALLDKALKATDFKDYEKTCREIELQVLRDLPLIGLSTLSFTVARRANVNLGYEVKGGYARWRFHARRRRPEREGPAGCGRYIFWRLVDAIPTVFFVLTLVFVAMRILPGDPALAALGDNALPDQLAAFREKMGLNVPLWQQYLNFLKGVVTLDLGAR